MSASSDPQNIRPFRVAVSDDELTDLKDRLARTRWAPDTPGEGWSRGVPTAYLRELGEYWQTAFDWRAAEGRLNAHPQFLTEIDGYDLHFLHVRSDNDDATPLLLVHGWPGSVAEFLDVIPLLTGDFHLVIPSLPGFGFGGRLEDEGWTSNRIAQAFVTLMKRLDYERYGVQGGDIGAFVAPIMGRLAPERIIGLHVNALITFPSGAEGELDGLTPAAMHVNQVPKAKLSGEHVRPAKGLSRERCQVLDMLRSTGPEQWPKDRVAQHAAVERVLKAMNGLNPASELQQGWHRDTSQLMM